MIVVIHNPVRRAGLNGRRFRVQFRENQADDDGGVGRAERVFNQVEMRKRQMKLKRMIPLLVLTLFLGGLTISAAGWAEELRLPFPSYGSGPVEVRIYTDYFCSPCRRMEPAVEPLLKNLITRNAIRLTLVDMPFSSGSILYARYFLYALNEKNDFDHALKVRNALFSATADKNITTAEKIESLFKRAGISFRAFEPKLAFNQYNDLIKEDHVDSTPSCVIVREGKKKTFVGGGDVVNALREIK